MDQKRNPNQKMHVNTRTELAEDKSKESRAMILPAKRDAHGNVTYTFGRIPQASGCFTRLRAGARDVTVPTGT